MELLTPVLYALTWGGSVAKSASEKNYVVSRACHSVSLSAVTVELGRKYTHDHDFGEISSMATFGIRAARSLLVLGLRLDQENPRHMALQRRIIWGSFYLGLGAVGISQLYAAWHTGMFNLAALDPKIPLPVAGMWFDCRAESSNKQSERRPRFMMMSGCLLPYAAMTGAWGLLGKNLLDLAAGICFIRYHGEPLPSLRAMAGRVRRLAGFQRQAL